MRLCNPYLLLGVTAALCGCASLSSRTTYEDRDGDGLIDREYHAYAGRDCNRELIDTDFNGRYDKKIECGFALREMLIDRLVPSGT